MSPHTNEQPSNLHPNAPQEPAKGVFESFKGFVDDSSRQVLDALKSSPRHAAELNGKMQTDVEAKRAEERDVWRCWFGTETSPHHLRMVSERLSEAMEYKAWRDAVILSRGAYVQNQHVDPWKVWALYRDDEASKDEAIGSAQAPKWLSVDWFRRSPYSPVRLEANPQLQRSGVDWREAFEDLMCAALDKPTGPKAPKWKADTGFAWLTSLQRRGILPPQLPRLYACHDRLNTAASPVHQPVSVPRLGSDLGGDFTPGLRPSDVRWRKLEADACEADLQDLADEFSIDMIVDEELAKKNNVRRSSPWQQVSSYEQEWPRQAHPGLTLLRALITGMTGDQNTELKMLQQALDLAIHGEDHDIGVREEIAALCSAGHRYAPSESESADDSLGAHPLLAMLRLACDNFGSSEDAREEILNSKFFPNGSTGVPLPTDPRQLRLPIAENAVTHRTTQHAPDGPSVEVHEVVSRDPDGAWNWFQYRTSADGTTRCTVRSRLPDGQVVMAEYWPSPKDRLLDGLMGGSQRGEDTSLRGVGAGTKPQTQAGAEEPKEEHQMQEQDSKPKQHKGWFWS